MRFSLILVLLCYALPSLATTLKVTIDPGHGGVDVGAHRNGINESEITLKISKLLYEKLKNSPLIEGHLTRNTDQTLDLEERVQIAHSQRSDLFLSIHANASPDPRAKGVEFYFQNQLEPNELGGYMAHQENQISHSETSRTTNSLVRPEWAEPLKAIFFDLLDQSRVKRSFLLSKSLRETWQGTKKSKAHSVKQAPFHVVSRTEIPSTLVEVGFLTNPKDFKALQDEVYLNKVADSLLEGLERYRIQSQEL